MTILLLLCIIWNKGAEDAKKRGTQLALDTPVYLYIMLFADGYRATLSSHLTILSITSMDKPVAQTNTNQHAQIGTLR